MFQLSRDAGNVIFKFPKGSNNNVLRIDIIRLWLYHKVFRGFNSAINNIPIFISSDSMKWGPYKEPARNYFSTNY